MANYVTNLGETIKSMGSDEVKLDRNIKNILAFKPILARIFKEVVIECENMSYEAIEGCIEGDVKIELVGLNPGTTNIDRIEGRTQEDSVYNEGKVVFDIRTVLHLPNTEQTIGVKLLIDVEAQNDATPGYDLSERAIYYKK